MFSSLCVVSLWRNNTFSKHMLTRTDQWVTKHHWANKNNTRKPRFQDQWVAKTIEKTEQNKNTKISEPMDSQNHGENNKQTPKNKISEPMVVNPNHWSRNLDFLNLLFGFLDGFGCPLVLKSWLSYCCWFYLWFWLPMDPGILVFLLFLVFSVVLAIPVVFTLVSLWFSRWFYT